MGVHCRNNTSPANTTRSFGTLNDRVSHLVAWPHVDQVDFGAVEVELVARVEQGRGENELDPFEVVVLQQLLASCHDAGVEPLECEARKQSTDSVQEPLTVVRPRDLPHPVGHRPVRDNLGALEELIAPDVVRVLVRVDDAPRHSRPHAAEQFDHATRVGQVRLRIDHHASGQVDEAGVRVADSILLVDDREAVVADLLHVKGVTPRL
jgi:hypothetical protein